MRYLLIVLRLCVAAAPGVSVADEHAALPTADHWSFGTLARPQLPHVRRSDWVQNPVDRFVLTRLESEGITPAAAADRFTLIRRVTLDLIGLPPGPDEVAAFVSDTRPDAYERLVDRLLSSPHYGEKWARSWLDLCHYADTEGYLQDKPRPVARRYRAWLVDALNRDMPFDQFTMEQLAGDLLPNATTEQRLATGFLRNTLSNREGGADLEEFRVEQVVDRTMITGTAWLGLTVGFARCHDHKYDPITQKDFYQLYAYFNSADEINIDAPLTGEEELRQAKWPEYQQKRIDLLRPIAADVAELQARWEKRLLQASTEPGHDYLWDRQWEVLGLIWGENFGEGQLEGTQIVLIDTKKRTQDQQDRLTDYFLKHGSVIDPQRFTELKLAELSKELEKLLAELPKVTRAPTMAETQTPRSTYLHVRGDFRIKGIDIECGTPACLSRPSEELRSPTRQRGSDAPDRLALATWLMAPENPLTARVTVNRAWQEFFGRGLVPTSEDVGSQGQRPSHPELLDWLAVEFRARGWSVKELHRLIVTSATYRQSSKARPELASRDPSNELLARQTSLRLSSDQLRDATLAVGGLLNRTIGGPSVFPPQPKSVAEEGFDNKWEASQGSDRYRRGLYTFLQRLSPFAQGVTFDAPALSRSCTRRERSNTPLQALTLLNDPVFFEAAQALAEQTVREKKGDVPDRIEHAFRVALSRPPGLEERDRLIAYYQEQVSILREEPQSASTLFASTIEGVEPVEAGAWTGLCSLLLNLHEFITRD